MGHNSSHEFHDQAGETTLRHEIKMTVNGRAVTGSVEARTLLVQFIREHLKMTGTHVGCDTTQ